MITAPHSEDVNAQSQCAEVRALATGGHERTDVARSRSASIKALCACAYCKVREATMGAIIAFAYGVVAYLVFFFTFLYAIGFVTGIGVPKTIDTGPAAPLTQAVIINLLLMSLFAIQHSIMARKPFKQWITRYIPVPIERSTYVLLASLVLILLFWQWRPIPTVVWQATNPALATSLLTLSLVGWLIVLLSTLLINHFELFGLQQVSHNLSGRTAAAPTFKTPGFYAFVRHPIYVGFIIAFWATPVMTVGHLLFSAVTTAYIFVGIFLEERDLVETFGDEYRRYRERVGMVIPRRRNGTETANPASESAAQGSGGVT
jgi:methanethiol S-methyltransferase